MKDEMVCLEPFDWRYSAAIVGLQKYLEWLGTEEPELIITEDTLEYNRKYLNKSEFLKFAEYYFKDDMHHIEIENKLKEKNPTEDLEVQDISILESTVEEVAVMEPVIERPLTIGERAKEISTVIRNDYGRYDNVPVKVKAELFQFSVDDFEADMKLHSLVLKELNVRMYSSELYDDYMSIVDATDKKKLGELQKVDHYSKEKRWNQSR